MQLGITSILVLVSSMTFAQDLSAAKPSAFVMCRNKKIVRTLRIEAGGSEGAACSTTYTKAGVDRVIGTGQFEVSCKKFLNNVRGNLEEAGWKCRNIEQARISSSATP